MSNGEQDESRGWLSSKALVGAVATLTVTFLTLFTNCMIQSSQRKELKARLYTELMTRREEAESGLRKDMFKSIITSFLEPDAASLEGKVLNLELLAYNFHGSLDLKPLFLHLDRNLRERPSIRRPWELSDLYQDSLKHYHDRLIRVAREVKSKQISALVGSNPEGERRFFVPKYPQANSREVPSLYFHYGNRCNCCGFPDLACPPGEPADSLHTSSYVYHFCTEVDSVMRRFDITIHTPDYEGSSDLLVEAVIWEPQDAYRHYRTARDKCAKMQVDTVGDPVEDAAALYEFLDTEEENSTMSAVVGEEMVMLPPCGETLEGTIEEAIGELDMDDNATDLCVGSSPQRVMATKAPFSVSEYDFPIIDNTRLSHDQRFAIVLLDVDYKCPTGPAYEMALVCFPGRRGGMKDQPYYEDIVRQLVLD